MKDKKLEQEIIELIQNELPTTSLLSHGYWNRAFAVLGHYIGAYFFIMLIIFGVALAFGFLGMLMSVFN